jgi:glycosyltransferase involved in cell wall biosynthesis
MSIEYSVIIPSYNESESISKVISEIRSLNIGLLNIDLEIIVVDDGSDDKTSEIVSNLEGIRLLRHEVRRGNGAAVKTGIIAAKGKFVIMIDADGQYQPKDIPQLISSSNDNSKMTVGARMRPQSYTKIQRDIPNIIFNYISSWVSGQRIGDLTSGLRLIDARLAKSIVHMLPEGFSYPTTATLIISGMGYPILYTPIVTVKRSFQESRLRYWKDGIFGISAKIIRFSLIFFPVKFFLPTLILLGVFISLSIFSQSKEMLGLCAILFVLMTSMLLISVVMSNMFRFHLLSRELDVVQGWQ